MRRNIAAVILSAFTIGALANEPVVAHMDDGSVLLNKVLDDCVKQLFGNALARSYWRRALPDLDSAAIGKLNPVASREGIGRWGSFAEFRHEPPKLREHLPRVHVAAGNTWCSDMLESSKASTRAGQRALLPQHRCRRFLCPPVKAKTGGRMGGRNFRFGFPLPKVIEKRGKELGAAFSALVLSLYLLAGFGIFTPPPLPQPPPLAAVASVQPAAKSRGYELRDVTVVPATVIDMAGVLSNEQRSRIVEVSRNLREDTGSDLAVFTEKEIARDAPSPKQQATMVFNAWGLGNREKNNGVLIQLITGQRRLEVEVGTGLDSAYGQGENARGPQVQRSKIVPLLKVGKEGEALVMAAQEYAQLVREVDKARAYDTSALNFKADVGSTVATVITSASGLFLVWRSRKCDDELRARLAGKLGANSVRGVRFLRWATTSDLTDPRDIMETRLNSAVHGVFKARDGRVVVAGWPRVFCAYDRCPNCQAWTIQNRIEAVSIATEYNPGLEYTWDECMTCLYRSPTRQIVTPMLEPPTADDSFDSSGSDGGGFSDGGGSGSDY